MIEQDKIKQYAGVIPAMISPCQATKEPDIEGVEKLAHTLIKHGCHGLFVAGSTGELPFLDEDQRREIVRAARHGAGDKAMLYAGVSAMGIKQILRYTQNAAEDGADVAVAMAPFFLKADQNQLYAYICEIADESPIPVAIYNHLRMPSQFETETVLRLAQHPNIVAIKDSSATPETGIQLASALKNMPLSVFQGREPFILETLTAGGAGCVSALANIAPEWHRILYDAVHNNDLDKAVKFQKKILSLSRIFSLNDVKQSFAHFAYAIRCATQSRGWIKHTFGMIPGFKPSIEFKQSVLEITNECGIDSYGDN